jgi:hypothetical protein
MFTLLLEQYPVFHSNERFLITFKEAQQEPLCWAKQIQSLYLCSISQRFILISYQLCLYSILQVSWSELYKHFLIYPMCATWPLQLIFLELTIQIMFGEDYKLLTSKLCSFLQNPVTSSLLNPNISLSTLFCLPCVTYGIFPTSPTMEIASLPKTVYQTAWQHMPEDCNLSSQFLFFP